ncbi:MAG: threonine/serine exporter family protein [Helicobacter sp.]|nr:threonine/serine exporter family protein [Helicobacter sp.]MDE7196012.1 threonine/serine exporter family protein [Helicobacter sp.]MDE7447958.1 threonine/serine exporter family protein [Helicobacter sp.]
MSVLPKITASPSEDSNEEWRIETLTHFLLQYAQTLLRCGAYTTRIIRCVTRIAQSYGYNTHLSILTKHITLTLNTYDNRYARTYVLTSAKLALNFRIISELSALSWRVYDERISVEELIKAYQQITQQKPRKFWHELFFIPLANASLCHIFGGDIGSFAAVFVATILALIVRKALHRIDTRLLFVVVAFVVSCATTYLAALLPSQTVEIAIASSVLFLVPGIPIINATLDILDSHILTGIARGVDAGILIVCIAAGMFINLQINGG